MINMKNIKMSESFRIIGNFWMRYKEYICGIIFLLLWLPFFVFDLIDSCNITYAIKSSWFLLVISLFSFLSGFLMNNVFSIKGSTNHKGNEK